ncbi:MAG: glutamyl-tRNA reductase, partial [Vicinamibacterales bacterium]
VPWSSLSSALTAADIVVCATGASEPVLPRARVEEAMHRRRRRPLFLIDIAVPRDVDPAVGTLEQVFLYNIDDLQAIVHENLARRTAELERAERIVAEEVSRFVAWMQSREIIPTVVALRERFETIRRSELQRLESKLAALPPEARARVDEITHLIIEKLLLTPTEQLKALGDETLAVAYTDALNRLFSLADDESISESRHSEVPARARAGGSQGAKPAERV